MNEQRRLSFAAIGFAIAAAAASQGALAQGGAKPPPQETNVDGVSSEVIEAVRKDGVLTLKVRYRNTGTAPAKVEIFGSEDHYYVTAGSTKYLILKDSKGVSLAVPRGAHGYLSADLKPNGSFLFWAKYPAPPAEAKKISFYNPHTPPFEDIPVTESK